MRSAGQGRNVFFCSFKATAAVLLACVFLGALTAGAQGTSQTLTINAHLCPNGYTATDYAADCTDPVAGAHFNVSSPMDLVTDENGTAFMDVSNSIPGDIRIAQDVDAQAGPKVSCVSDGENLDIHFGDTGATWAPIEFNVPLKADVVCDLYYSNDLSFGLVSSASSAAGGDNGTVQLPDTGIGDGAWSPFGLSSALTWLVAGMGVAAAGFVVRRRVAR